MMHCNFNQSYIITHSSAYISNYEKLLHVTLYSYIDVACYYVIVRTSNIVLIKHMINLSYGAEAS